MEAAGPPSHMVQEFEARPESADLQRPGSVMPKACENCRLRKIRCTKVVPCSNCQISGLKCTPSARRVDYKPRRHAPAQLNRTAPPGGSNLEAIDDRLQRVEAALTQLINNATSPRSGTTRPKLLSSPVASDQPRSPPSGPSYQGDSSFDRQTLAAEQTAQELLEKRTDSELAAALVSLKAVLQHGSAPSKVDSLRFIPHPAPSQDGSGAAGAALPPARIAATVIRRVKEEVSLLVLQFALRDYGQLETLCQRAYFPSEPLPAGGLTLLNGVLLYLIEDQLEASYAEGVLSEEAAAEYRTYRDLCEKNFYSGLQSFDALTIPTLENVQSLLLGAARAQESSRPALSWTLLSAASRLCHALGYHRKATLRNAAYPDVCRHAFWMTYMMEKNLVLNFGRPSSFHDDDIDAELFAPAEDPRVRPWDLLILGWVEFAVLQGRIYDRLYSVRGLNEKQERRVEIMEELAEQLDHWRDRFLNIDGGKAYYEAEFDYWMKTTDFVFYAILTLLYRVEQPSGKSVGIASRCVEAARLGLDSHIKHFDQSRSSSVMTTYYVHWVFLYPSCTPLVVVFSNAIAARNHQDLRRLEQVLATLELMRSLSDLADRLYHICAAFVRFANAYLNVHNPQAVNAGDGKRSQSAMTPALEAATPEEEEMGMGVEFPEAMVPEMLGLDVFLGNCLGEDIQPLNGLLGMDVTDLRF